jgi:hypothetical protein
MKFIRFEHEMAPRILLPLLGGLFALAALQSAARAEPTPAGPGGTRFVVSAADGYGVNDCIKSGDDCAKIVADAWCQAHGLGGAKNFGPASDITGAIARTSVKTVAVKSVREDDVYIACGE